MHERSYLNSMKRKAKAGPTPEYLAKLERRREEARKDTVALIDRKRNEGKLRWGDQNGQFWIGVYVRELPKVGSNESIVKHRQEVLEASKTWWQKTPTWMLMLPGAIIGFGLGLWWTIGMCQVDPPFRTESCWSTGGWWVYLWLPLLTAFAGFWAEGLIFILWGAGTGRLHRDAANQLADGGAGGPG